MKLLFILNSSQYFLSHRLPLALAALEAGHEVHVACPEPDSKKVKDMGMVYHSLPFSRSGTKPWMELYSLWAVWRLLHQLKPNILHLVTIKPVLYGGLMARLTGVPSVVAAISGLGSVFVTRRGSIQWLRYSVELLYKIALNHSCLRVIFQNPDDKAILIGLGAVREDQSVLIRGSGVALNKYTFTSEPQDSAIVTLASRLLREKGVFEFVEAAKILKARGIPCRFWLVGDPDPGNPSSISSKDIENWSAEGLVEILGFRTDIADVFASSHLIVLPSYREGLPKALIEAAACGRPVITTDVPGCRDTIEPNVTGLLVPVRDAKALADAIERLIKDDEMRHSMGKAGRKLAEREFGIEKVIQTHLKIYQELIESCELR